MYIKNPRTVVKVVVILPVKNTSGQIVPMDKIKSSLNRVLKFITKLAVKYNHVGQRTNKNYLSLY